MLTRKSVAFVHSSNASEFHAELDPRSVIQEKLSVRGIDAQFLDWKAAHVDWQQFDKIIIREVWDYVDEFEQFKDWLQKLEKHRYAVENPPGIIRNNWDKMYLRKMKELGAPVLPSIFVSLEQSLSKIEEAITDAKFLSENEMFVLKLSKSSNSRGCVKTSKQDLMKNIVRVHQRVHQFRTVNCHEEKREQVDDISLIVQPFFEQISYGELSFVFFNGEFSHAVRKIPAQSDFRVQQSYGGRAVSFHPPAELIAEAKGLLQIGVRASFDTDEKNAPYPLIARVDALPVDGILHVMELEMIEPQLFFEVQPWALDTFCDAVVDTVTQGFK